jgi:hypothetical protein
MPDIKHPVHKYDTSEHTMQRLYQREKVSGKYRIVPVAWKCTDCGLNHVKELRKISTKRVPDDETYQTLMDMLKKGSLRSFEISGAE